MRYFDPVSYRFYITCINDETAQNDFIQAFREVLIELKIYILEYMDGIETQHVNGTLAAFIENGFYDLHFRNGKCYNFERFMSEIKAGISKAGLCQIGHGMKQQYYTEASENQRQYNSLVRFLLKRDPHNIDEVTDEKISNLIYSLINCPNTDLSGITFSSGAMDGFFPFHIEYESYKIGEKRNEPQIIGCKGDIEGKYKITILVEIPRYVFNNREFPFQQTWIRRLKNLCEANVWSYGVISMDAFKHPYLYSSNAEYYMNKCYFGEFLPCYAWGMCFNKEHKTVIGGNDRIRASNAFADIQELSNGGVYIQMSQDICDLSRDTNTACANFLKPFIPKLLLPVHYPLPVSFRLSIGKDDIILPSPYGMTNFTARYFVKL